jgi:hypothetical protein
MFQDRAADASSLREAVREPWVLLALVAAAIVLVAALFLH